ncbi:hypothetical protein HK096_007126, partial [Nowakowskiella sp. JEL0078]
LTWPQQIAVAVRLLVEKEKEVFVENLIQGLDKVHQQLVARDESMNDYDDPEIEISDELNQAATNDQSVKLLFDTLKLVKVEDKWFTTKSTTISDIQNTVQLLKISLNTPLETGKLASSMIKPKKVPTPKQPRKPRKRNEIEIGESEENNSATDASLSAEDNPKSAKKIAKPVKPELSAAFLTDTEDELNDPEFFRLEREKRRVREEKYQIKLQEYEESVKAEKLKKEMARKQKNDLKLTAIKKTVVLDQESEELNSDSGDDGDTEKSKRARATRVKKETAKKSKNKQTLVKDVVISDQEEELGQTESDEEEPETGKIQIDEIKKRRVEHDE